MVERVKGDWRGDCLGADLADLISRVKGEAGASHFMRQEASRRGRVVRLQSHGDSCCCSTAVASTTSLGCVTR